MEKKKPLFQGRFDKWTWLHFLGSAALCIVMIVFLATSLRVIFGAGIELLSEKPLVQNPGLQALAYFLTFIAGVFWEIAQWNADKSTESIDILDITANMFGAAIGLLIWSLLVC